MQGKPQDAMTVGIVHFMAFPQTMGGSGPIAETVNLIAEDPFFGAVGDFIEHRKKQCPRAPGWVWDAAKWELAHRLASTRP